MTEETSVSSLNKYWTNIGQKKSALDKTLNMNKNCYCGSEKSYQECCEIRHHDLKTVENAEQLMRARYSAFCLGLIDFLYQSFHPSSRRFQKKTEIAQWSKENQWVGLEVLKATENTVEFKARFIAHDTVAYVHHEKSRFQKLQGTWYYVDGKIIT